MRFFPAFEYSQNLLVICSAHFLTHLDRNFDHIPFNFLVLNFTWIMLPIHLIYIFLTFPVLFRIDEVLSTCKKLILSVIPELSEYETWFVKKLVSFYSLLLPILFSLIHYCLYFMISPPSNCLYGKLLKSSSWNWNQVNHYLYHFSA